MQKAGWIFACYTLLAAVLFVVLVFARLAGSAPGGATYGESALLLFIVLLAFGPNRYRIRRGRLEVLWGALRIDAVPIERFSFGSMTPGRHPVTWLPATGVRLALGTKNRFYVPENVEGFLAAILAARPDLYRYGNDLRPRPELHDPAAP